MRDPNPSLAKATRVSGGLLLSVLLGALGGAFCGAAILIFAGLIGRSGNAGKEYVGNWSLASGELGLLYGCILGAVVGPIAYALIVRRIGLPRAILPAFLGTLVGGFAGALAGPPVAVASGIFGFFFALSWTKAKWDDGRGLGGA